MTMIQREFPFKLKSFDDQTGHFEGYLSVSGNLDEGMDIVDRGAFTKTLQEQDDFPLLWQHQRDEPIGKFTAREDPKGLYITGEMPISDDPSQTWDTLKKAYYCMKHGIVKGLSIGYDTVKKSYDPATNIRHLQEVKLFEGSVVTFPMNTQAQLTTVKCIGDMQAMTKAQIVEEACKSAGITSDKLGEAFGHMEDIIHQLRQQETDDAATDQSTANLQPEKDWVPGDNDVAISTDPNTANTTPPALFTPEHLAKIQTAHKCLKDAQDSHNLTLETLEVLSKSGVDDSNEMASNHPVDTKSEPDLSTLRFLEPGQTHSEKTSQTHIDKALDSLRFVAP